MEIFSLITATQRELNTLTAALGTDFVFAMNRRIKAAGIAQSVWRLATAWATEYLAFESW
jgi:hypothetical protein